MALRREYLPKKDTKKHALSVFLIREDVALTKAIKPGLGKIAAPGIGDLYYKQNPRREPKWLAYLVDALEQKPSLYGATSGAVLIVTRKKRSFAVCFGLGRHLLQPGSYE
jgi:uncharacterized protein (TIGR04141 family)